MHSQTPRTVVALLALPITDFVQRAYIILLGRQPERHETAARAAALRSGWGRARLLENIVSSPEFGARERLLPGDGSPRAFVERQYFRYMNRAPDAHGLEHYTKMLNSGASLETVRRDIGGSEEARATGSFWTELDRLLEDERKNMQPLGRWFGLLRRQERRRNLELEVLTFQRETEMKLPHTAQGRSAGRALINHQLTDLQQPLTEDFTNNIDSTSLPPAASRMLSRLCHHQPKTSLTTLSTNDIY